MKRMIRLIFLITVCGAGLMPAAVCADELSAPVLKLNLDSPAPAVSWGSQSGVHYELEQSNNVFFSNVVSRQYFQNAGGEISVPCQLNESTGFWRVSATGVTNGIGFAGAGAYAGKLIRYDSVNGSPVLLKAFGVNYYDAFLRYIRNSADTSFIEGFQYLSEHHIPVARVLAAGFWPNDWKLYFSDPQEYFRRLDFFISKAEQYNIGLILDLFWAVRTVGELVDDAVDAGMLIPYTDFEPNSPLNIDINGNETYAEYTRDLGRTNSGSNALITRYTKEIVSRYAGSPAIWGWEFGNEYNLGVDHPNLSLMRSNRLPGTGMTLTNTTPDFVELPEWTGPDDLTRADVLAAKENFARTVRSIDSWRMIISGDSCPRISAYRNWTEHKWTPFDTRSEMAQVLPVDNPAPMDTICVHLYSSNPSNAPAVWFPTDSPITNQWGGPYDELIGYFAEESRKAGRPLIIGEWGTIGDGTTDDEKETFHQFMQALIDSDVQLSLLWTFDSRNIGMTNTWWIQTGMITNYPASPKLYQISNNDPDLWDLEQANLFFK